MNTDASNAETYSRIKFQVLKVVNQCNKKNREDILNRIEQSYDLL